MGLIVEVFFEGDFIIATKTFALSIVITIWFRIQVLTTEKVANLL